MPNKNGNCVECGAAVIPEKALENCQYHVCANCAGADTAKSLAVKTVPAVCARCSGKFEAPSIGRRTLAGVCPDCLEADTKRTEERRREAERKWVGERLRWIDSEKWKLEPFWDAIECPPRFRWAQSSNFPRELTDEISRWEGNPDRPLLTLTGAPGVGKTRALWAVAFYRVREVAKAAARRPPKDFPACDPRGADWAAVARRAFRFARVPDLVISFQAMAGEGMKGVDAKLDALRKFSGALMLDDLGAEKTTPFAVQCLYSVLAAREEWGRPTALTTNLTLDEIARVFDDRIASRLAGGYVLAMGGPDRRLKRGK
jgi:hypothetical protein